MTIPAFDIFRTEAGYTYWVESAVCLHDARARIEVLQLDLPGAYFIFDQRSRLQFPEQINGVAETKLRDQE
jgi:hypothetical protein